MESQHSVGVPTCHDFPRFVIISEKLRSEVVDDVHAKVDFFGKKTPYGKIFTNVFRKDLWRHRSTSCVRISWKLADLKSVKSRVAHQTKKQQNFGWRSRSRVCADRARNLSGPAPDNILGVPQISSKSVHFQQSYSRTCERRWNAPQSVSNTRRSYRFFAE